MAVDCTPAAYPLSPPRKERRFYPAIFVMLVVLLLGLSIVQALHKNMHHNLTWGAWADSESMAVAISDLVFGLNRGYVAHAAVFHLFRFRFWQDLALDDPAALARMKNADFINKAIHDATQLEIKPTVYPKGDFRPLLTREWLPIFAEDIGRADYYKLAFSLFGFKIESMHFLYFLILSLSVGLFCAGFYNNLLAMSILIVSLTVLNLIIAGDMFSVSMPSISAYRAISALSIIPITHLTFCIWQGIPWKSVAAIAGIGQALLYVFVTWARSSAQWGALAIVLIALITWWQSHDRFSLSRNVVFLPLFVVFAGIAGTKVYTHYAAHPAYFTDELLPHHMFWHSAYLGLSLHPDWPNPGVGGDEIAFSASRSYLAETQPDLPFTQSPITNGYWFGLHDRTMRHLFLQFAYKHPWYMVGLYGWYKPRQFVQLYRGAVQPSLRGIPLLGLVIVMSILVLSPMWLPHGMGALAASAWVPTGVIAFSSLAPIMWAYPASYVMVDSVWTVSVFVLVLIGVLLGIALEVVYASWRQRS
jgi:hypothetical protein